MSNSHITVRDHVHLHEPNISASPPCIRVNTAPPKTADMNTPDALEVYLPKPFIAREKIQLHMVECNRPIATRYHKFWVSIEITASIVANRVVTVSCVFAEILLKKLEIALPTKKPPQYNVDSRACIPKSIPPIIMSLFPKNVIGFPDSASSNACRLILAPIATSVPT